jgi:cytochrome P450
MAWMASFLAERPDAWSRLRDEAHAVGELPRAPRDLKRHRFAEAVFRETLRLYPPAAHDARVATSDLELAGHRVRAGTMLSIPVIHLSRHPDLYADPDAFRPERWLDRDEGITPIELVQFGGGQHFCLGYHLAWMEAVQFATALALHLPARGPRLDGPPPRPRYLPLLHPSAGTRLRFD